MSECVCACVCEYAFGGEGVYGRVYVCVWVRWSRQTCVDVCRCVCGCVGACECLWVFVGGCACGCFWMIVGACGCMWDV